MVTLIVEVAAATAVAVHKCSAGYMAVVVMVTLIYGAHAQFPFYFRLQLRFWLRSGLSCGMQWEIALQRPHKPPEPGPHARVYIG